MSFSMDLTALSDMWRWKWHKWKPFGEYVAFAHYFVAPCPPTTLQPYRRSNGIFYISKRQSKMVDNSASYPVYSRHSKLPWIASYKFVEKHMQTALITQEIFN